MPSFPHSSIVIPSLISPTLSSFHFSHSALGYDIFYKYCFISLLCMLSCFICVHLFATRWNIVCQTPLSVGFPRQEYWSGLSFPSPGDLLNPGIKPMSLMPPVLAGRFLAPPGKRFPVERYFIDSSVIVKILKYLSQNLKI